MTAIHKKRLTIIAILTACAMFVIGLFFVFRGERKPETAKAEEAQVSVEKEKVNFRNTYFVFHFGNIRFGTYDCERMSPFFQKVN